MQFKQNTMSSSGSFSAGYAELKSGESSTSVLEAEGSTSREDQMKLTGSNESNTSGNITSSSSADHDEYEMQSTTSESIAEELEIETELDTNSRHDFLPVSSQEEQDKRNIKNAEIAAESAKDATSQKTKDSKDEEEASENDEEGRNKDEGFINGHDDYGLTAQRTFEGQRINDNKHTYMNRLNSKFLYKYSAFVLKRKSVVFSCN
ncbi:unnamed protein product [Clavelina lepadiformis]|uniref:Uncharacterized protein n=2 Tax=Clavelina lepadiformis TaxID=159417 RepID=A0ABP0F6P8_CLALP